MRSSRFGHQRLHVYHLAREFAVAVNQLTRAFPRGNADLRDQLRRASASVLRHIAEGAGRSSPRDKASRFTIARGECAECDASLDLALGFELGDQRRIEDLRHLAERIAAMLTKLILRQSAEEEHPIQALRYPGDLQIRASETAWCRRAF